MSLKGKVGIVLEGGGMRGLYTIGVLDLLDKYNYMPDYIIGVSAGACNGVSYAAKQKGRAYRVIMDNITDKRYVSVHNLIKTKSMFGMDFIFDEIPHQKDLFDYNTLLSSKTEFITGVTDVETGKSVFFDKSELQHNSTILRASSSIPVFAPIVKYKGGLYLDGGTSCPIPAKQAIEDGCDHLIIVLTQHRGYKKSPEKFRSLYKMIFKKYPNMISTLDNRHNVYNQQLDYVYNLERQGKATIVAPSTPITISRFEKETSKLHNIYLQGFSDAETVLKDMLS